MSADFVDTNIVLYLLDGGEKAVRAEELLRGRPRISVQVLNETLVNCRRKAKMSWDEAGTFVSAVEQLCIVEAVTLTTHRIGRALAERYQLAVYDAMIVASALTAGCDTLYSEDMHDGLLIEGQLRVVNPFV